MNTGMEATAAPHQSGPSESAACSSASSDDHVVCFRDQPACVTGTGTTDVTSATPSPTPCPKTRLRVPVTVVILWPIMELVACRCTGFSITYIPVCNAAVYFCFVWVLAAVFVFFSAMQEPLRGVTLRSFDAVEYLLWYR